ncbi:MAG: hypothetical protein PGN13_08745 [Patulibacter minatonensis]
MQGLNWVGGGGQNAGPEFKATPCESPWTLPPGVGGVTAFVSVRGVNSVGQEVAPWKTTAVNFPS